MHKRKRTKEYQERSNPGQPKQKRTFNGIQALGKD